MSLERDPTEEQMNAVSERIRSSAPLWQEHFKVAEKYKAAMYNVSEYERQYFETFSKLGKANSTDIGLAISFMWEVYKDQVPRLQDVCKNLETGAVAPAKPNFDSMNQQLAALEKEYKVTLAKYNSEVKKLEKESLRCARKMKHKLAESIHNVNDKLTEMDNYKVEMAKRFVIHERKHYCTFLQSTLKFVHSHQDFLKAYAEDLDKQINYWEEMAITYNKVPEEILDKLETSAKKPAGGGLSMDTGAATIPAGPNAVPIVSDPLSISEDIPGAPTPPPAPPAPAMPEDPVISSPPEPPAPPPAPVLPGEQEGEKNIALYDYEARSSEELSFIEGEIVFVIEVHDDGWGTGTLEGGTTPGLVPMNYLKEYEY